MTLRGNYRKSRMIVPSRTVLAVCLTMAGLSTAFAQSENADTSAAGATTVETVVVTANKRIENLQNVGTSGQALSSGDVQALRITSTTDIANLVPGVQVISPNTNSDNFFSIRGVSQNDFSEHQESPVAVYFDEVYMSQAAGTGGLLFDTERVEVLRGPQGTLFGRNATGGLVQYFSKAPTDELEGYATVSIGAYERTHYEGAIGGPVAEHLSARLSFAADESYGNSGLRNTEHPDDDPLDQNSQAGRFQLLYRPDAGLEFHLIARAARQDITSGFYSELASFQDPSNHLLGTPVPDDVDIFGTCPGCDAAGYKNTNPFYTSSADFVGHNKNSTVGVTLIVKYRLLDNLNLTSISDFSKFNKNYAEDSDGSPNDLDRFFTFTNVNQESQELRLDNGADGRFRWVAGFYYLHIGGNYRQAVTVGPVFGGPLLFNDPYRIETRSYAPFAQAEFDIFKNLTFTLGYRWNVEDKTIGFTSNIIGSEDFKDPPFATFVFNGDQFGDLARLHRGDWSGRVGLNWHVTDDIMAYVTGNRGIKAGGFNAPLTGFNPGAGPSVDPTEFKFDEERILSTEVGVKSEFLSHRLRVNADAFYYDYKNFQAFKFNGLTQLVFNAPAIISGGEVQVSVLPLEGLLVDLGASVLDARVHQVPLPDGTLASRHINQSPKYSVLGRVRYAFAPSFGGDLSLETDFNWRADQFYNVANTPSVFQPSYWLQNFHASYTFPNEQWTVSAYLENAFDKHYFNNIIDVSALGYSQRVFGTRRLYGFQVLYQL